VVKARVSDSSPPSNLALSRVAVVCDGGIAAFSEHEDLERHPCHQDRVSISGGGRGTELK
jgi:hypothetical protein